MKQKLIISFLAVVLAASTSFAQTKETVAVNAGSFEHITISSGLDVVLLPSTENIPSFTMDDAAAKKVGFEVSNNAITISGTGVTSKKDFTIYLYVSRLKSLVVENDASVRNLGVLNAPDLHLFVGSEARAHLKTNGAVNAQPLSDSNIKIRYVTEKGMASLGNVKKK